MQDEEAPAKGVPAVTAELELFPLKVDSEADQQFVPHCPKNFFDGFCVALVAGVFMGSTFDPPTYLAQLGQQDVDAGRPPLHSPVSTDYVVSHFTGILCTTVVLFLAYCVMASNRFIDKSVVM